MNRKIRDYEKKEMRLSVVLEINIGCFIKKHTTHLYKKKGIERNKALAKQSKVTSLEIWRQGKK